MHYLITFILLLTLIFSCSSQDLQPDDGPSVIGPVAGASGSGGSGGSGGESGDGGTGGEEEQKPLKCSALEILEPFELVNAVAGVGSVIVAEATPIEEGKTTLFMVEFYQFSGPQEEGEFDLTAFPDDNYGTCDRCFRVVTIDRNAGTPPETQFYQREGVLNLVKADEVGNGESQGEIERIELVEVTIDPYSYTSEEVDDPRCVVFENVNWDTLTEEP